MSLIYVENGGSDTTGHGSLEKPYQSLAHAVYAHGEAPFRIRKSAKAEYEEPTPTSLKKANKIAQIMGMKAEKQYEAAEAYRKEAERRDNRLEESKAIVLHEDLTLPTAIRTKIARLETHRGNRVRVSGWVHCVRLHREGTIFLFLRDGTEYLQSVLSGLVAETYQALTLTRETTVELAGTLHAVPQGGLAPGGHELSVDYWRVVVQNRTLRS